MKKNLFKKFSVFAVILCLLVSLAGCAGSGDDTSSAASVEPVVRPTVRVTALKGPTGMGMAKLMAEDEAQTTVNDYNFTIASAPDEISAEVIKGNFDIAAVPVNLAAVLNKKTDGAIQIAAVNTLGVLHILENGNTITSVQDLKGKTIYATGQGSTPEYVLRYVLEKNGIDPDNDVTIEYLAEHSELATKLTSGDVTLGMLPEPNVTSVLNGNADVRLALDMTAEWDKVADEKGSLVQGVIIVSKKFAEENKEALDDFLKEYYDSVSYVNSNIDDAAELVAKYGIVPAAAVAKKAIPNCNICCVTGNDMQLAANAMFEVLYNANPQSVGGAVPGEEIYYKG